MVAPLQTAGAVTFDQTQTSLSVTLPAAPAAGNLLTLHVTVDKSATVTGPAGWTEAGEYNGASVTGAVYYRQADGTESGPVTATWSVARGGAAIITEHSLNSPVFGAFATFPNPVNDTAVTSVAGSLAGDPSAASYIVASVGIDTGAPPDVNERWPAGQPTFTNMTASAVQRGTAGTAPATNNGGAAVATAYADVAPAAILSTTAAWTGPGGADQAYLTLIRFTGLPPQLPTTVEQAVSTITVSKTNTSLSATIAAPRAGRLLTAHLTCDKASSSATITDNLGGTWNALPGYYGLSVTGAMWWKVATGSEETVTASWTTANGAALAVVEHRVKEPTLLAQQNIPNPVDDTTYTSLGPISLTGAGRYVVASAAVDSAFEGSTNGDGIAFSSMTRVVARVGTYGATAGIDNGGAGVSVAIAEIPAGGSLAVTLSWPTLDQAYGSFGSFSAVDDSVVPVTCTGVEVGAVTGGGATVAFDFASAAVGRAVLSTSVDLTSPIYGSSSTAGLVGKSVVTGLAAGTVYFYGVEVDGVLAASPRGQFRTARSGAASFKVLAASCAGQGPGDFIVDQISNAPTFKAMQNIGADLFLDMGDRHYGDLGNVGVSAYVAKQAAVRATARRLLLWSSLWLAYHYDDHDGPGNNWLSTTAGVAAAQDAYELAIPHFPLAVADTQAQTFVNGRVRFILLDTRSKRVAGDILGAAQRDWCLNLLNTVTEPMVVFVVGLPWIGDGSGSDGTDGWGSFAASRAEIAAGITAARARGVQVMIVAGDAHMVAMDDGTNSQYDPTQVGVPGPAVCQFGPMDSSSSVKGGPYSLGTFTGSRHQFGVLDVVDDGATVTVTATGYSTSTADPFPITALVSQTVSSIASASDLGVRVGLETTKLRVGADPVSALFLGSTLVG